MLFEKHSWFLSRSAQQATHDNRLCFANTVNASKNRHNPVNKEINEKKITKKICIYWSLCRLQGWACPYMSRFNPIINLWRHWRRLTGASAISPLGSAIASVMQQKQGETIGFTSQSGSHAAGHCVGLACPGVFQILIWSNSFNHW